MTALELAHELRQTVKEVPGVAAVIVDRDGVRASAGAGFADLAQRRAASPDMVCPWFSMTKIVTATVAMRLVDGGLLDLDAPIAPTVRQMRHLRPVEDAARITARHLLSYSAGLANPIPLSWIHPPDRPGPDPDELLDRLLSKHGRLRFTPGSASSYSNLSSLTLGAAMTRLAGMPFADLVVKEVLRPLQMNSTGFAYSEDMSRKTATGYHQRWSPMRLMIRRWVMGEPVGRWISLNRFLLDGQAYGGLIGPVADAARFVRMHLRDGELDGVRVLKPDSAQAMREIRTPGKGLDLGLGWFRPANFRDAAPPLVEHLGGGAGFFNVIRIYPSSGVGISVMGNATKFDIDRVAALALRA